MQNRNRLLQAIAALPGLAACGMLLMAVANKTLAADEPAGPAPASPMSLDDLRTFSDVYNAVRRNYVDPVPETDLLDSALRGMVEELDPYSSYLSPEEFQRQDDSASGQYGGIGITLDIRNQRLVVEDVAEAEAGAFSEADDQPISLD